MRLKDAHREKADADEGKEEEEAYDTDEETIAASDDLEDMSSKIARPMPNHAP